MKPQRLWGTRSGRLRRPRDFRPDLGGLEDRLLLAAKSTNVAIIGGPISTNGGELPTTGTDLAGFNFTNVDPATISAATLAPFDTVVLNVASAQMGGNTTGLTASQKADLVAFVGAGHKMVIYDSESHPSGGVDYTWLPFPFRTSNPGGGGASGTLTIAENNTLGTSVATDPHFIDAAFVGSTQEVGDANVMTTFDPHWALSMAATNSNNVTGPVEAYAEFSTGTNTGLFIYSGFDLDNISDTSNPNGLRKIYVQQLAQPFSPSGLPHSISVVGINLTTATPSDPLGQPHTVTATLSSATGQPLANTPVTFTIVSGPDAGASGTTNPINGQTDAQGHITFTYNDRGVAGTDTLQASFVNGAGTTVTSQQVTKTLTGTSTSVFNITLAPSTSKDAVGKTHTVTARIADQNGVPLANSKVTFTIVSGPDAGVKGTTNPVSGRTNAQGRVVFTYKDKGKAGTDTIRASFVNAAGTTVTSNRVTKVLTSTPSPAPTVTNLQRVGFHSNPTEIVLTFSQPLNQVTAQQLGNYSLTAAGPDGTFNNQTVRLAWASYDNATRTVTLRTAQPVALHTTYRLVVNGTAPDGLTSNKGVLLAGANGKKGTDFVTTFNSSVLVGQSRF